MARPRIIIADTDEDYIIPLQFKFMEEFFEKIDLEIITEEAYFDEVFSSPQRADILILSEDLYDPMIQRHNITHILVMTEQYEEEQSVDLHMNCVFKYTSIKAIFNEIIRNCSDVLGGLGVVGTKATQVVLVYSASGGAGKTTLAMGMSSCLTQDYKNVLYINAENLQTFQSMLKNPTPISTAEICAKLNHANHNVYDEIKHMIRKEIFHYLPPFKAALMSIGISYSIFEKIVSGAKKSGDYDFIVIDVDSSFDEDKAKLISLADKVIVVTEQTETGVYATNILLSNLNGVNQEKYIFVCNKFRKEKHNAIISPKNTMKFSIHEYIDYFETNNKVTIETLSKFTNIKKVAFLVM